MDMTISESRRRAKLMHDSKNKREKTSPEVFQMKLTEFGNRITAMD